MVDFIWCVSNEKIHVWNYGATITVKDVFFFFWSSVLHNGKSKAELHLLQKGIALHWSSDSLLLLPVWKLSGSSTITCSKGCYILNK